MKTATVTSEHTVSQSPWARLRRALMLRLLAPLQRAEHGHLTLVLPEGDRVRCGDPDASLHAQIRLNSWRAVRKAVGGGTVGWSESYVDGDWDSPDISAVIQWALLNERSLTGLMKSGWVKNALMKVRHRLNTNNKRGSRRNIAYHYDLGNDFYGEWLDDSMTYSAALFEHEGQSLADAQAYKYQQIIDRLAIDDGDSVLEIGCGWGGFAEHLAGRRDVRLHGVTLSERQLDYAQRRIRAADLQSRAEFSLTDYRDIEGQYDHIVSIEMLEAVGEDYWPIYFQSLSRLLKPGGSAAIQVITIDDRRFEQYRQQPDFIQTHIFPGGMLPSPTQIAAAVERTDLKITDEIRFGEDYARTLEIWDRNFQNAWPSIEPQGFDEQFKRLWRYYFAYCHGGFRASSIDVRQIYLRKSG